MAPETARVRTTNTHVANRGVAWLAEMWYGHGRTGRTGAYGPALAWAASALPLSHNSWTTTSPYNPLYVQHKWYWMPQSHTWQPLSMCRQNSIRRRLENSLHQERTHAEWFTHSKCSEHLASCWKI